MFQITTDPISIETTINQVIDQKAGAITTFIGTVRELTNQKKTDPK